MRPRFTFEEIDDAFDQIDTAFLDTPQFEREPLSKLFDCHVILKVELASMDETIDKPFDMVLVPFGNGALVNGIATAMAGFLIEPSAAIGLAAMIENPELFRHKRVALILTGSNLTEQQIEQ